MERSREQVEMLREVEDGESTMKPHYLKRSLPQH